MTSTRKKLRGLTLAVLMVTSVFVGSIALSGTAAAASNVQADTLDPDVVNSGATESHDINFSYEADSSTNNETVEITLPVGEFDTSTSPTVSVTNGAVVPGTTAFTDGNTTATFNVSADSGNQTSVNVTATVNHATVSQRTTDNIDISVTEGGTSSSDSLQLIITPNNSPGQVDDFADTNETRWYGQQLWVKDGTAGDVYQLRRSVGSGDNADTRLVTEFTIDADGEGVIRTARIDDGNLPNEFVVVDESGEIQKVASDGTMTPTGTQRSLANETQLLRSSFEVAEMDFTAEFSATNFGVGEEGDDVSATLESRRAGGYYVLVSSNNPNVTDTEIAGAFDDDFQAAADMTGPEGLTSGVGLPVAEDRIAPFRVDNADQTTDFDTDGDGETDVSEDVTAVVFVDRESDTGVLNTTDISINGTESVSFNFSVVDSISEDTVQTTLEPEGVEETGFAFTGADYEIVGDQPEQQAGDVVTVRVDYDESSLDDNQNAATVVTLGGTDSGFVSALLVSDTDGDGVTNFTVNTYALGTTEVNTTLDADDDTSGWITQADLGNGTYAIADGQPDVYKAVDESAADEDEDEPADGIAVARVDDEYFDQGFDAFELERSIDSPVDPGGYTLRTHNITDLESDEKPIELQQRSEDGAVIITLGYPVQTDSSLLRLTERDLGDVRTWVAPAGDFSELDAPSDVIEGVTGDVSSSPTVTQSDVVAQGDTLVVEVQAEGLGGQIAATRDLDTATEEEAFLGEDGVFLYIGEESAPQNQKPFYVDLNGTGVELIDNQEQDTYYFAIDTDEVEDARDGSGPNLRNGEYEVRLVKSGGPFSPFIDDGEYPDFKDINFNELFETSSAPGADDNIRTGADEANYDPYQGQGDQVSASANFSVDDRTVSFDDVGPDGNLRKVAYDNGTVVSGTATVAPGTQFSVRFASDGDVAFLKDDPNVVVQSGRTWSTTINFGDQEPAPTISFDARAQEGSETILSPSQSTSAGTLPGLLAGSATVTIDDQTTRGQRVSINSTFLPKGGFVTMHDASLSDGAVFDSVRGTTQYLPPGTHENVGVQLDDEIDESQTLIAMPHQDTDSDQTYDFISSEGADDAPYTTLDRSSIVTDSAEVTVEFPTPEPTPTDTPEPDTPEPDTPEPDTPTPTDAPETATPTDEPEEPTDTETTSDGQPGFGLALSLIALIGAALIALRRRD